jgi:hypothetical protein
MRRRRAALCLVLAALLAGCVSPDGGTDRDRPGGFYGGVSGGMTRP